MSNTFWLNNPLILVDKDHVTEIFPASNLSYVGKLNAITRIVIILSILGYLMTKSVRVLMSAAVTIVIIAIIYKTQKHKRAKNSINKQVLKEGFTNCANYEKHKSVNKQSSIKKKHLKGVTGGICGVDRRYNLKSISLNLTTSKIQ